MVLFNAWAALCTHSPALSHILLSIHKGFIWVALSQRWKSKIFDSILFERSFFAVTNWTGFEYKGGIHWQYQSKCHISSNIFSIMPFRQFPWRFEDWCIQKRIWNDLNSRNDYNVVTKIITKMHNNNLQQHDTNIVIKFFILFCMSQCIICDVQLDSNAFVSNLVYDPRVQNCKS